MADGQARGNTLADRVKVAAHALAHRLERLEAGAAPGGVDADALGVVVIDGDKHRDLPLSGPVVVMSVPHILSTASGMMVPSWLRGPRGSPTRPGASRAFSRISRSTRRSELRMPAIRSRAQTFR
jgi:hypothetical protein